NGSTVKLTADIKEACTGAHVIYADVWVSMGEPAEVWAERIRLLEPYRVTQAAMAMADPTAIFLHCLPSFHDTNTTTGAEIAEKFGVTEMEVEDVVFESAQSKVFAEAENRMHTIKAVMYATLS
ncbi:MAG: ornithine carbamoyltransferase, partial [Raoultibacter sp.]